MKHGLDLDAKGARRQTPLHCAASAGKAECVALLKAAGANTAAQDVARSRCPEPYSAQLVIPAAAAPHAPPHSPSMPPASGTAARCVGPHRRPLGTSALSTPAGRGIFRAGEPHPAALCGGVRGPRRPGKRAAPAAGRARQQRRRGLCGEHAGPAAANGSAPGCQSGPGRLPVSHAAGAPPALPVCVPLDAPARPCSRRSWLGSHATGGGTAGPVPPSFRVPPCASPSAELTSGRCATLPPAFAASYSCCPL